MRQFIRPTLMMTMDDRLDLRQLFPYLRRTTLDHRRIHTQVGNNDIVWPCKIQDPLFPLIDRTRIDRSIVLLPTIVSISKFNIFPLLMPIVVDLPPLLWKSPHIPLHMIIDLPCTNHSHIEPVESRYIVLIEKSTVHPNNDRYIRSIFSPNQIHQRRYHVHHRLTRVTMLAPPSKYRIHHPPVPKNL